MCGNGLVMEIMNNDGMRDRFEKFMQQMSGRPVHALLVKLSPLSQSLRVCYDTIYVAVIMQPKSIKQMR